jgi:hypothetical protein
MPFVLPMEEAILPSLPLVLVPSLTVPFAIILLLRSSVLTGLLCLLSLLATPWELYVENLLIWPLLWLLLALASITPLCIPIVSLELLVMILLF